MFAPDCTVSHVISGGGFALDAALLQLAVDPKWVRALFLLSFHVRSTVKYARLPEYREDAAWFCVLVSMAFKNYLD